MSILKSAAFLEGLAASKIFLEAEAMVKMRETAERIAERGRELAPIGGPDDPTAGRLHADIGIKGEGIEHGMPFIDVGTTVPEGLYQEFGTVHDAPQPFMRPAIHENSK